MIVQDLAEAGLSSRDGRVTPRILNRRASNRAIEAQKKGGYPLAKSPCRESLLQQIY